MQDAYLGESFPVRFRCTDPENPDAPVENPTCTVYLNGAVVQSGTMGVDGDVVSFRFEAEREGVHELVVAYTMAGNRWVTTHRISVRSPV